MIEVKPNGTDDFLFLAFLAFLKSSFFPFSLHETKEDTQVEFSPA